MTSKSHAALVSLAGLGVTTLACLLSTTAAADDKPGSPTIQTPPKITDAVKKVDYGFCSGPQNAHKYATNPVKVSLGACAKHMSQTFSAMSDGPSVGNNCGGFSMAFGPIGNLNPKLNQITMVADWGDAPLTSQNCPKAKITTQAYGERCLTDACDKTTWDVIGPKQNAGNWDGRTCKLATTLTSTGKPYRTLNLDIIATVLAGNEQVRKKAKGSIKAELKDGDCYNSAETKPAIKR